MLSGNFGTYTAALKQVLTNLGGKACGENNEFVMAKDYYTPLINKVASQDYFSL